MKRLLLPFMLMLVPRIASADAAQDVRDIRAGQLPVRQEMLGWDGGTAWMQTLVCSEGGTISCVSALHAIAPARKKSTVLLEVPEVYCGQGEPCTAMDAATVNAFVSAEKTARAAMPKVTKGAAEKDPTKVFGTVVGEATTVEVRTRDVSKPDDGPTIRVELVVRGKGGATELLAVLDPSVYELENSTIQSAYVSADKKAAVFVTALGVRVMCWSFSELDASGVDIARKRASLANTIGFRAYGKNDLVSALGGFTEATTIDPTFGLGWYNRASVESRNGEVAAAKASLAKALAIDASFEKRACRDADFKPLRAAEPSSLSCG